MAQQQAVALLKPDGDDERQWARPAAFSDKRADTHNAQPLAVAE